MTGPRFSVVTTTHDDPLGALRDTLRSVQRQSYDDWEWCIVDDVSADASVLELLREHEAGDPRIRVVACPTRGGSARAVHDACTTARASSWRSSTWATSSSTTHCR